MGSITFYDKNGEPFCYMDGLLIILVTICCSLSNPLVAH